MKNTLNTERLAIVVKSKRGDRSLRGIAAEIGNISPSTLSRVERGVAPDMATFLQLCDWLELPASNFLSCDLGDPLPVGITVPDRINLLLRSDRKLDKLTVDALTVMVRLACR